MLPSSLLAFVVVAASITPGYIWVRVSETRVARPERTQLLELAELIIVGALASSLSFLSVLSLASWFNFVEVRALADDGTTYALENPSRSLGVFVAVLGLAYGGTWAIARLVHRDRPPIFEHGSSAWQVMLGYNPGRSVYATVDLRDGTTVAGWVHICTVEPYPAERRELVLVRARGEAIKIRALGSAEIVDSPDHFVIINGADVVTIGAAYFSGALGD